MSTRFSIPHVVAIALIASNAWGQGEASIIGSVVDATGAPIPEASITLTSQETGANRKVATDASGHYELSLLGVGGYEVTVEKTGFQTGTRKGVTLVLGQRATVDFTLSVGEIKESVQ